MLLIPVYYSAYFSARPITNRVSFLFIGCFFCVEMFVISTLYSSFIVFIFYVLFGRIFILVLYEQLSFRPSVVIWVYRPHLHEYVVPLYLCISSTSTCVYRPPLSEFIVHLYLYISSTSTSVYRPPLTVYIVHLYLS